MFHAICRPKCEKCPGALSPNQEVDLLTAMSFVVYRYINCGRRTRLENKLRSLSGKHIEGNSFVKNVIKPNS